MRIIAGQLGGRRLLAPAGSGTRPAMARTREALFSMLEARGIIWQETKVLDLFAGTGSLAFEALSRGAPEAALVDSGFEASGTLLKNAVALGIVPRCRIIRQDVLRFLRTSRTPQFNLVFVDPPYRRAMGSRTLQALAASPLLAPGAVISAELETGAEIPAPAIFTPIAQRQFGQTFLHIWEAK